MDPIGITVGKLNIAIDLKKNDWSIDLPDCHKDFINEAPLKGGLYLLIRNEEPRKEESWHSLYSSSDNWQLWQDKQRRFLFIQPNNVPPKRHIIVDEGFTSGEIIGNFKGQEKGGIIPYPLKNIGINLFINWLAGYYDLVFHAFGVKIGEKGYCFIGSSGAGKSTLALNLINIPHVEILGEDNIIIRNINGHFRIFGTPWHHNPKMCSASSAKLERVYFLDRSIEPGVIECDPLQGITRILQTAFIPYYRPNTISGILDRLHALSSRVPFLLAHYQLGTDPLALF